MFDGQPPEEPEEQPDEVAVLKGLFCSLIEVADRIINRIEAIERKLNN